MVRGGHRPSLPTSVPWPSVGVDPGLHRVWNSQPLFLFFFRCFFFFFFYLVDITFRIRYMFLLGSLEKEDTQF
jgi:hypothetical protein